MNTDYNLYQIAFTLHSMGNIQDYTMFVLAPSPSEARKLAVERIGGEPSYLVVKTFYPCHAIHPKINRDIAFQFYDRVTQEKLAGEDRTNLVKKPIFPPIHQGYVEPQPDNWGLFRKV